MKQTERVLEVLRERGDRGVHTFELRAMYIANPSARIMDLEGAGHVIRHGAKERLHGEAYGVRYTLVRDADAPAVQDDGGQLRFAA